MVKPEFIPSWVQFHQETGQMGPNISLEILALRDRQRLTFHRKSKHWEGSVLVFLGPPPPSLKKDRRLSVEGSFHRVSLLFTDIRGRGLFFDDN